jgi:hypothetical protein
MSIQAAMDKLSQMMSMISNVVKKQSDMANEIAQNIRG